MWIGLILFGAVQSALADEFGSLGHQGEFTMQNVNFLKHVVPAYNTSGSDDNKMELFRLFPEEDDILKEFNVYLQKGVLEKGLTFNIYDDDMRSGAIALYRLLKNFQQRDKDKYVKFKKWAQNKVNSAMVDYSSRLACLFNKPESAEKFMPPFIDKPNYYVTGDTVLKAFYYRVNKGNIKEDLKKIYQIMDEDENTVIINANYSLCNIPQQACVAQLKYFGEDVALNSYYYGLHLLHPFWMTDEELNEGNPNHAAYYYFAHQQLYARYLLEKEHIDPDARSFETKVTPDFLPNLYYENGLSFPTRTCILGNNIRKDVTFLQTVDIAITECIQRGIVKTNNGTLVQMDEDNYFDLLAKFLRSQIDNTKVAKVIRSVFGYATNGYPVDIYNPAPSVMHHPQTSLRDPVYWYLIQRVVDYFMLYTNNTESFDFSKYEKNEIIVRDIAVSKIVTTYGYYLINLEKSLTGDRPVIDKPILNVYARQKRLIHKPFTIKFSIDSKYNADVVVRIFLGPLCSVTDCWKMHSRFFQLDCYRFRLFVGSNNVTWAPETSLKYSSDQTYNKSIAYDIVEHNYDIFKFPKNLAIPKGREDGLNLTMFLMILDEEDYNGEDTFSTLYSKVTHEISNKPLGFPFHRQVDTNSVKDNAPNYRFVNITVYHEISIDNTGYFSSYLD